MTTPVAWIAFTKSRPLEGCSIDFDGGEFYYAELCIPLETQIDTLKSISEIINLSQKFLIADKLELVEISKIIKFAKDEWDANGDLNQEIITNALKSLDKAEIQVGSFRSEEIQEDSQLLISLQETE